ncbi:nucleotide-binding domain containing protein [Aliirhizobium terrae]|uniref:nucleotide-binding domain containing protein n=1 Tax=Terrirhizobium terrae TaxID=2926709 RepID=UPI003369F158
MPENFRRAGLLAADNAAGRFEAPTGGAAILAGSCSEATRGQIKQVIDAGLPALKLDPIAIAEGRVAVGETLEWALSHGDAVPLIYSSADPEDVLSAQKSLGHEKAGAVVENFLAQTAIGLRERGIRRLIVAGGETSGAVVGALSPSALFIGQEIAPGVPWTLTMGDREPMALALKSGNFGAPDFFLKAWDVLK